MNKSERKGKRQRPLTSKELNHIIRSAALSISDNGSIDKLAEKAFVSGEAIRRSIRTAKFSVGLASALEAAVGRQYIQREVLCPLLQQANTDTTNGPFTN